MRLAKGQKRRFESRRVAWPARRPWEREYIGGWLSAPPNPGVQNLHKGRRYAKLRGHRIVDIVSLQPHQARADYKRGIWSTWRGNCLDVLCGQSGEGWQSWGRSNVWCDRGNNHPRPDRVVAKSLVPRAPLIRTVPDSSKNVLGTAPSAAGSELCLSSIG
jgi:hypothetical protein